MSDPIETSYEEDGFGRIAGIIASNEARREPWDDPELLWQRIWWGASR